MSKSAVAKASTIVYFGPSDTLYCRVGSIDANETVEVHAKELNYYYITYTAGSTKKRGFVPVGSFVNESGLPTAAMFNSGCLGVCTAPGKTPVYYGPNSSGFASVGTISHSETFTVFLPAVNDWYYIEYSTSGGAKRGFIPISIVRNLKGILARTNTAKSVYAGPKTSYALLGGLSQYEYCVLVAYGVIDSTAWFQAEYSAGGTRKRGYIQDDNLTRIGNGVAPYSVSLISTYATMSANAVVFAGPSTLYSNIGRVAEDEIIMPVREENILSNTFKLIDYATSAGRKRGYVPATSVGNIISFTHKMEADCTVYSGPSADIYASIGSVSADEGVRCIFKELDYFCIDYIAGSVLKRGYVAKNAVSNYASVGSVLNEPVRIGYLDCNGTASATVYTGPNMTTYALAGTVAAGESVTVIENSASGFLHIEYSSSNKTKRGYIQSSKLEDKKRGKLARVNGNLNEYHVYNGPDLSEDNTSVYVTNESVYNGEYVIVLDQIEQGQYNRAWYYIDFNTKDGRKRGYIPQDSITDIRGNGAIVSERKGAYIARGNSQEAEINLYFGPSDTYAQGGAISSGELVSVLAGRTYESDYAEIEYCTETGNLKRKYIKRSFLAEAVVTLPTLTTGISPELICTSPKGHPINAYKIGSGANALVALFAIHGYEDAWAADGVELVKIANALIQEMEGRANQPWANNWSLYVIPVANPDGILHGYTHCGPGRANVGNASTQAIGGVDMNRCFPVGFPSATSRRNYTGSTICLAPEAAAIKVFIDNLAQQYGDISFLDVHGWQNTVIGDTQLGQAFVDEFGFTPKHNRDLGYITNYIKSLSSNSQSALVELPNPVNSEDIISRQFKEKVIRAVRKILGDL